MLGAAGRSALQADTLHLSRRRTRKLQQVSRETSKPAAGLGRRAGGLQWQGTWAVRTGTRTQLANQRQVGDVRQGVLISEAAPPPLLLPLRTLALNPIASGGGRENLSAPEGQNTGASGNRADVGGRGLCGQCRLQQRAARSVVGDDGKNTKSARVRGGRRGERPDRQSAAGRPR